MQGAVITIFNQDWFLRLVKSEEGLQGGGGQAKNDLIYALVIGYRHLEARYISGTNNNNNNYYNNNNNNNDNNNNDNDNDNNDNNNNNNNNNDNNKLIFKLLVDTLDVTYRLITSLVQPQ